MLLNACALSNCIFFFPFFLLNSLLPFLCEWVKEDDFYLFVFSRQSGFCTPSQELKIRCSRFNRNQQMVYKSHKWLEVRKGRIEKTSMDTDGVWWLVVGSRGMQTPCMSHSEENRGEQWCSGEPGPSHWPSANAAVENNSSINQIPATGCPLPQLVFTPEWFSVLLRPQPSASSLTAPRAASYMVQSIKNVVLTSYTSGQTIIRKSTV